MNMDPSRQETNPYGYVTGNPVKFTDPSGFINKAEATLDPPFVSCDAEGCQRYTKNAEQYRQELATYNVIVPRDYGYVVYGPYGEEAYILEELSFIGTCQEWEEGKWKSLRELDLLLEAVKTISTTFEYVHGGDGKTLFISAMRRTVIYRTETSVFGARPHSLFPPRIVLTDSHFKRSSNELIIYWTVHEFGHRWNWTEGPNLHLGLRQELEKRNFQWTEVCVYGTCATKQLETFVPGYAENAEAPIIEDWAESFAGYIMGETSEGLRFDDKGFPLRRWYVERRIKGLE